MKRILFALCLFFALGACASQVLESYVGRSIEEPILDYGPPSNVLDLQDGTRAFQWQINSSGVIPTPTTSTGTVYGPVGFGTITTTSTAYVPYSQSCLYTLLAKPSGKDWIVVGFRQPTLGCE